MCFPISALLTMNRCFLSKISEIHLNNFFAGIPFPWKQNGTMVPKLVSFCYYKIATSYINHDFTCSSTMNEKVHYNQYKTKQTESCWYFLPFMLIITVGLYVFVGNKALTQIKMMQYFLQDENEGVWFTFFVLCLNFFYYYFSWWNSRLLKTHYHLDTVHYYF